jgi:hypothetical protein
MRIGNWERNKRKRRYGRKPKLAFHCPSPPINHSARMEVAHNPSLQAAIAKAANKQNIAHRDIVPRFSAAHGDGTSRAVAGFGPYLIRAARRGLSNAAKDLLFVATRQIATNYRSRI